jgi:c-di-AMP phosphodiesterase-like protein
VDEARQVLDRVRERIANRILIAELPVFTVSFGLASSDQGDDFEQVVSLADSALLSAKAGGRDQIVISAGPDLPAVVGGFWDPSMPAIDDPISGPIRESQRH